MFSAIEPKQGAIHEEVEVCWTFRHPLSAIPASAIPQATSYIKPSSAIEPMKDFLSTIFQSTRFEYLNINYDSRDLPLAFLSPF